MNDCCVPKGNGKTYDLAVIGAGSAGFSAAITAADDGARVALIGGGTIGGTCVNAGCVPSKTLIRATETLRQARAAQRFSGISASAQIDDWGAVARQKDDLVASLRQAKYLDLLPAYNNIAYLEGKARLRDGGVLVGEPIAAAKIIITSGARPAVPDIPGIAGVPYLTSTTALELTALPRSLLVIGAGYVGAELSQMFFRAGVARDARFSHDATAKNRGRNRPGAATLFYRRRHKRRRGRFLLRHPRDKRGHRARHKPRWPPCRVGG